jgi:hypothetical protein
MNANLGGWDTSKATTLYYTFNGASKFIGDGIFKWDIAKIQLFVPVCNCHGMDSAFLNTALTACNKRQIADAWKSSATFTATSYDTDWASDTCPAPCVAGSTWSSSGNAPCSPCAAASTCAAGVKTACAKTANTVCNAPTLSFVTMGSITATGGTLSGTSDQAGVIYYSILAAAASAPDAATIKAENTKVAVGTPGQAATTSIAGLTASTAYKTWVVAYDSGDTLPSAVTSASFTTSAEACVTGTVGAVYDTFSASGVIPCSPCTAASTCGAAGVTNICTKTTNTVCSVSILGYIGLPLQ